MGGGKPVHEGWLTKSPPQSGAGLKVRHRKSTGMCDISSVLFALGQTDVGMFFFRRARPILH